MLAEATPSSTAAASSSITKTGMSSGAKTGLAVGIILAVVLVAAGVLFLYWKKKKSNDEYEKTSDEKTSFGASAAPMAGAILSEKPSTKAPSPPPTLEVRPMSQFRFSQANPLNTFNKPAGVGRSLTPPRGPSPTNAENPFSDPTNPFGDDQARAVPAPVSAPVDASAVPAPLNISGPSAAAIGVATGAAAAATTSTANRSPKMSGAAAGQSGSPGAPQNNVHRVQLDFKPSMDDELELRSGQLVRMLHEYDDGWVSSFAQRLLTIANTSTGSVHSPRSFSTGCCSSNLPFAKSRQTASCEQWSSSNWSSSWSSSHVSKWSSYDTYRPTWFSTNVPGWWPRP